MAGPAVTVVTSTYNYPSVLKLAMTTALQQSFTDFEYLVVGDCCSDETEEVVAGFDDPRIRWMNLQKNKGNQADVNRIALKRARGSLIAYLNHDDLWYPEHLETLVSCIRDGGFDMAASLALAISPPPHYHRQVLGLPVMPAERSGMKFMSMTSTVMHTKRVAAAAGGWRNWRKLDGVPTLDFFKRVREQTHNHAVVPRITCLKFHSADRRNSYRHKDAGEQAHWLEMMKNDPDLRHREMALAYALKSAKVPIPTLKQPKKPEKAPPGWQIEQFRRLRGLEPILDLGADTPVESDEDQAVPIEDEHIRWRSDGRIWFTDARCKEPSHTKGSK